MYLSDSAKYLLYFVLVLFPIVSPFVGDFGPLLSLWGLLFVCLTALLLIRLPLLDIRGTIPLIWLLYLFFNVSIATKNNIPLGDVFRSIAPFVFYPITFMSVLLIGKHQAVGLVKFFLIVSLVLIGWSVVILIQNGIGLSAFATGYRLTFNDTFSALPISVCGLIFTFTFVKQKALTISLVFVFLLHILATKSKGLALLTILNIGALYLFYYQTNLSMFKAFKRGVFLILGLSIILYFARDFSLLERFMIIGTDSDVTTLGRIQEIMNAIEQFVQNPLMGVGNGYSFAHIGLDGHLEYRRYTHSFIFYFLATTGIIGLILYLLVIIVPVKKALNYYSRYKNNVFVKNESKLIFVLALASINVNLYSMVSASYKLIHMNIMLGLFHGVIFTLCEYIDKKAKFNSLLVESKVF